MTLGNIGTSYDRYNTLYQQSLERDCSTVDQAEAENGAAQSDSVRVGAKRLSEDGKPVTLAGYLQRAKFVQRTAQRDTGSKDDSQNISCPIDKARSESLVGENVPLNWLVADQMGGHASTPQREDFSAPQSDISFQSPAALFTLTEASDDVTSGGTLLEQEWLLTPCH